MLAMKSKLLAYVPAPVYNTVLPSQGHWLAHTAMLQCKDLERSSCVDTLCSTILGLYNTKSIPCIDANFLNVPVVAYEILAYSYRYRYATAAPVHAAAAPASGIAGTTGRREPESQLETTGTGSGSGQPTDFLARTGTNPAASAGDS